ncbi:MAG: hypothetical protein CMG55_07940 [Candidatus Marinimicrobia bacterium]|nr:hypothetical protein [Candidatus Neomarinimicrobiota bacterium]|tara:strand:- start:2248 stop:3366 length:1119 start_codon:yes stop_codon:yes gene_type:complete
MKIDNFLKIIMSPKIFSYTLIWLIVLVFFGTIAQKNIGLYASQMKYFSSFFFLFLGFIPLPGGRLILLFMTINLFSSLFKRNLWQLKKFGIIIVHLGGLLLLLGGGLTAYFSSEGNMIIAEGETSNYVDDYHDMELVFVNNTFKDSIEYTVVDEPLLKEGNRFNLFENGPEIYILSNIKNVRIENRISPADSIYKGLLEKFVLLPKKPEPENTQNRPALIYKIQGTSNGLDGIYGLFLGQGLNDYFQLKEQDFHSEYRRKRTYVPFEIELIDFEKIMHPGTNVAKSFSSEVNLIEDGIPRRTLIKMNEPLRHKGYTFFQASFIENLDKETTVLATVKNYGRLFPYISSIIMSVGLLIHLLISLPKMIKKKST